MACGSQGRVSFRVPLYCCGTTEGFTIAAGQQNEALQMSCCTVVLLGICSYVEHQELLVEGTRKRPFPLVMGWKMEFWLLECSLHPVYPFSVHFMLWCYDCMLICSAWESLKQKRIQWLISCAYTRLTLYLIPRAYLGVDYFRLCYFCVVQNRAVS